MLDAENSLILIKSGLQFLEYMSDVGNNNKVLADLMEPQLKEDKLIIDIFEMFTTVILYENSRFKSIYKHKKIKEMLFYFLIDSNRDYEKMHISESLINLSRKCEEIGREQFKCREMPSDYFINVMNADYLPIVLDKIYNDPILDFNKNKSKKIEEVERLKIIKCNYYFDLLGNLISVNSDFNSQIAGEILTPLLNELRSMKRIELNDESEDSRLAHLINLISAVVKKCPEVKETHIDKETFNFVLKDCLFTRRKDKSQPNYPICKTDATRDK